VGKCILGVKVIKGIISCIDVSEVVCDVVFVIDWLAR